MRAILKQEHHDDEELVEDSDMKDDAEIHEKQLEVKKHFSTKYRSCAIQPNFKSYRVRDTISVIQINLKIIDNQFTIHTHIFINKVSTVNE